MLAAMLPERPWLVKCPNCGALFWIDEARELGERAWWYKHDEWPPAPEPKRPSEADFLRVLSASKIVCRKYNLTIRTPWRTFKEKNEVYHANINSD